jgi:hypothetical protein
MLPSVLVHLHKHLVSIYGMAQDSLNAMQKINPNPKNHWLAALMQCAKRLNDS